MSPDAQCRAIFESQGWKFVPPVPRRKSFIVERDELPRWKKGRVWTHVDEIPDYLNDLNAMHDAFNHIEGDHPTAGADLRQVYWWELCKIVGTDTYEPQREPWKVFNATAAQRAEAFLRTLELWDDAK